MNSLKLISAEAPLAKEHRSIQIGFQGYAPGFKFTGRLVMPLLEIRSIERKTAYRISTRMFVPSIREDHATQIPKKYGYIIHEPIP